MPRPRIRVNGRSIPVRLPAAPGGGQDPAPAPGAMPSFLVAMSSPSMYIPLLGRSHDVHVAYSGNWSSPSTWSTGVVPTTSQDVLIQDGAAVTLDATGLVAGNVVVEGTLAHATSASSALACATLSVMESGTYTAGTIDAPIPAGRTATVTFADGAINTASPGSRNFDPEQWGYGLLAAGTFKACGTPRLAACRVVAPLSAGATTFAVPAPLADPTSAPTVAALTSAGLAGRTFLGTALQPGTYLASYTRHNGVGETAASPQSAAFTVADAVANPTATPTVSATGGGTTGGLLVPAGMVAQSVTVRFSVVNAVGETKSSPVSSAVTVAAGNIPVASGWPAPAGGTTVSLYVSTPGYALDRHEVLYATGITGTSHTLSAAPPDVSQAVFPAENTTKYAPVVTIPAPPTGTDHTRVYLDDGTHGRRMYGQAEPGGTRLVCDEPLGGWDIDGVIAISGAPGTATRNPAVSPTPPAANATQWAGAAIGDEVIVPETRLLNINSATPYVHRNERVTVTGVSGNAVTFTPALSFDHPGRTDHAGTLERAHHVLFTTRNVTFRSANPAGTRGHVLATMMASCDLRFARFQDLGRTLGSGVGSGNANSTLDSATFATPGTLSSVTHVGTNQVGRYPVHMHHLTGPMTADPSGYQFRVEGCHVDGGDALHDYKWGFDVHASHFGLLRGNTCYNVSGGGFTNEDGSECCNAYEWNVGARCVGSGQRASVTGTDGDLFWSRGPANYWRDNSAYGCHTPAPGGAAGTGVYCYGFGIFASDAPAPGVVPAYPGDMGSASVYFNYLPILEHARNEVAGSNNGMTFWSLGMSGTSGPGQGYPIGTETTRIRDLSVWNHGRWAIFNYENTRTLIDRYLVRGRADALAAGASPQGFFPSDYSTSWQVIRGADVRSQVVGLTAPMWAGRAVASAWTVEDASFRAALGVNVIPVESVNADSSALFGRDVRLVNCTFDNASSGLTAATNIKATFAEADIYPGMGYNPVAPQRVHVVGYQGTPGDDFRVYGPEQAPSASCPKEVAGFNYDFSSAFGPPTFDVGTWSAVSDPAAFGGTYDRSGGGATDRATYHVASGANFSTFGFWASWVPHASRSAAVTYSVYADTGSGPGALLFATAVNQRVAPAILAADVPNQQLYPSQKSYTPSGGSPTTVDFQPIGRATGHGQTYYVAVTGDGSGTVCLEQPRVVAAAPYFPGAPAAGLTNQQAHDTYGVCVGGELATCPTTRTHVAGFVCAT